MKRITVITGHYGCGKSTFAANLAVKAAGEGEMVTVVDMDTVNPYYRTADLTQIFEEKGVGLTAPMYAGSNLDIPVLDFDLPALYGRGDKLIIDLGGDDAGAYPLGKYHTFLTEHREETELLCVVNFRRFLTREAQEAVKLLNEIEAACRLKADGFVNNTNLGFETDEEVINEGIAKSEELTRLTGVPVKYSTCPLLPQCSGMEGKGLFPMEIYIKNVWN